MEKSEQNLTIGKYLSSIRKQNSLTLNNISEITKIKVRLLEKIESDHFDDLGGIGYAKAMILTYAKALGIAEEQIHELLQKQFSSNIQYVPKSYDTQPRKFLVPTKIFSVMLLIIVVALLSYLVINLYKDGVLTWPPFKKVDAGMQIKPKESSKKTIDDESKRIIPEVEKKNEMVLVDQKEANNVIVINDSTDHLDELLFKNKQSPYNYDK